MKIYISIEKTSNQCFFFSFENDSTKHRSTKSINQFKFEGLTKKNTNLTKICQTKTKFNQYNNQTKQNSRNCKNKWEIREKGSQTFWIFFFPLSIYWSGTEHANSKKVGQIIRESIRKREINHTILTLCVWSCREEMEQGG